MLTIIELKTDEQGRHGLQSQSHRTQCWLEGWIAVPEALESAAWESGGYCALTVEDGALTALTPTERPKPPAPEPTEAERLRADVDFLAAMGGVAL